MLAKHDANRVRMYNQKRIYDLIRTNKGISRAEIAQIVGISPTSVGKITAILIEEGLVTECGTSIDGRIGRNAILLQVVENKVLSLAVIIDVGLLRVGIVNINGEVLIEIERAMPKAVAFPDAMEQCISLIKELLALAAKENCEEIIGIGVSVPGFTDNGHIYHSAQMFWKDVDLGEALQHEFGERVIVENDVKSHAFAECVYGNIGTLNNILMLSMGSGVGGALIRNGRLHRGAHNALGELGHILVGSNGIACDCGRHGCLRTHIAKPSIEKLSGMKFETCLAAAQAGDEHCCEILDDAVKYASIWIANSIAIYDPSEIILTGDLFRCWPGLYEQVTSKSEEYIWNPLKSMDVKMRKSKVLSKESPLLSAASIVFYQYLKTGIQLDSDIVPGP